MSFKLPSAGSVDSPCLGCRLRAEGCHTVCMMYMCYREIIAVKGRARRADLINLGYQVQSMKREKDRKARYALEKRSRGAR